ncbi:CLOCK-interacting pacemaker [Hyperolius riggenbachi]|uniref:CLOCK-interacting pacemaker n=1 Tax=Hyperolius riggenbachi TaxID=752182 RepID=UPI0035A2AD2A
MEKEHSGIAALERHKTRRCQPAAECDKDSGFSDVASEGLSSVEQTDSEEAPPTSCRSTAQTPPQHFQPRPPNLRLLKDLLVDQGSGPRMPSWTVRPSFQLLPNSSQILLFPPSLTPNKSRAPSRKPTRYLPILNSYPRIAPHPSQLPLRDNKQVAEPRIASHPSQLPLRGNKRVAEPRIASHPSQLPLRGNKRVADPRIASHPSHLPLRGNKRVADNCRHNQNKKPLPAPTCTSTGEKVLAVTSEGHLPDVRNEVPDLAIAQSDAGDSYGTDESDLRAATFSDTSHKTEHSVISQQKNKSLRFQNTLDVLHHSGLLSIAIKTKELARINQATQNQLEKLQEQVSLYTKAMSSNSPEDWRRLQESLAKGTASRKEIVM